MALRLLTKSLILSVCIVRIHLIQWHDFDILYKINQLVTLPCEGSFTFMTCLISSTFLTKALYFLHCLFALTLLRKSLQLLDFLMILNLFQQYGFDISCKITDFIYFDDMTWDSVDSYKITQLVISSSEISFALMVWLS